MKISFLIFISAFIFILNTINAQLLVSPESDGSSLVGQLIGNNVTINNVVINCRSGASGIFYSNGSNIGIGQGVLLCTGKVQNAIGPNNKAGAGYAFSNNPSFQDPDIQSIEPDAKYDGCVLEFDIIPTCTKLEIKYVFASEEYPEFVGAGVNDAFGFFISGPRPSGGNYAGFNIAKLPNGTPIAIDNVNNGHNNNGPCNNCAYYIENNGSSVQYDGFTVPLTASTDVTPCKSYHLKLAIADAGDAVYDSGVFLEYKGIGCSANTIPIVTANTVSSQCALNNGSATVNVTNYNGQPSYHWNPSNQATATANNLAPGNYVCTLTFQNPCTYTKTVNVTVPNDPGFIYTNSITNVKCPQDANGSVSITVINGTSPYTYNWNTTPPQNTSTAYSLTVGQYICTIKDATGCVKKDTVELFATTTLTLNPISYPAHCGNPTGSIISRVTGGVPVYNYTYSTIPLQHTPDANNLIPGTYSLIIKDQDNCSFTKQVVVENFIPVVHITDSLINPTCGNANGAIYINSISGAITAPYSYTWTTIPISNAQNIYDLNPGTYTVYIKDSNNCPMQQSFTLNNLSYLPIVFSKHNDICDQKKGWINAVAISGTNTSFKYAWNDGQIAQAANALGAGKYWVTITDSLGCMGTDTANIINVNDSFNGYVTINPNEPEVNKTIDITLYPTPLWNLIYAAASDGSFHYDTINHFNYADYGSYNITYYLISDNGCKHTLVYDFFVKDFMTLYVPNTFTPNGDLNNDGFLAKGTLVREFDMQIFDRWGQLIFKSDNIDTPWDGTFKGSTCQIGTYTYKIVAKDYYDNTKTFVGHVNLIR